ncbi:RNA polymerase sigma factor [Rhodohalobacter sp.]|uniref:RNA polymerase sigma factor n=1 Tax=Rhodohalobacter sp. TaxID=1974210 RepID=UPI002ACDC084|nr:RNA polymerase sigma factor [Rhodohalobacter sp.]MDZ7757070.1 RNA polymerase sigma factor [Rhodohalobacter sp.]
MECKKIKYQESELDSLWTKVLAGDKNALSQLFNKTFDSLYNYGYRIIPDSENVRDAIQEVYFQIWKYRENLTHPDSVRSYLFISLRRELLNKKKSHQRRDLLNNKYYIEEFDALISYNNWDEILNLEEEESKELKKSIENLTPRQREVIYLKYYEGLSTEELSQILQMRAQSIYNLVFEAINNLRFFLDK